MLAIFQQEKNISTLTIELKSKKIVSYAFYSIRKT